MASSRPVDKEGMAKLQKKQRQIDRYSTSTTAKVVKLTPAEIRAQNNAQPVEKQRRHSSHVRHARELDQATPPPSPDKKPLLYEKHPKRNSTAPWVPLPTPPQSPVMYYSRTINAQQLLPNFSMPRPRDSMQASPRGLSADSSRRSSVSSYRGLPTYRGPEMTRTGSFTLLQHPSQQIVGNPLSYFSRPRRSGSASPARSKLSIDVTHVCDQDYDQDRHPSIASISSASEAPIEPENCNLEPPVRNVSPISFEANDSIRNFSIERNGVVSKPIAASIESNIEGDVHLGTAKPMVVARLDSTQALRDHGHHPAKPSKLRRHTIPRSGIADASADTEGQATEDGHRDQTASNSDPTVRPVSVAIPPSGILKGKERESGSFSAPVVRCCHKCGKMKKGPNGDMEALSPVLENPSVAGLRGAESLHMSGGVGQQVPPRSPKRNSGVKWEDRRAEGKIRQPPPPTIMRFASLRGYSTDTEGLLIETESATVSGVLMNESLGGEEDAKSHADEYQALIQNEEQDADSNWVHAYGAGMTEDAKRQEQDRAVLKPEEQLLSPQTTNTSSQMYAALTEPPEILPKPWQPLQESASESESDREARKKGLKIPRPNCEPRFSRSNMTLRGLVLPRGQSTTDLPDGAPHQDQAGEAERPYTAPNGTNYGAESDGAGQGDIARGLKKSKSIDYLRQTEAMKVAEIMAI